MIHPITGIRGIWFPNSFLNALTYVYYFIMYVYMFILHVCHIHDNIARSV